MLTGFAAPGLRESDRYLYGNCARFRDRLTVGSEDQVAELDRDDAVGLLDRGRQRDRPGVDAGEKPYAEAETVRIHQPRQKPGELARSLDNRGEGLRFADVERDRTCAVEGDREAFRANAASIGGGLAADVDGGCRAQNRR